MLDIDKLFQFTKKHRETLENMNIEKQTIKFKGRKLKCYKLVSDIYDLGQIISLATLDSVRQNNEYKFMFNEQSVGFTTQKFDIRITKDTSHNDLQLTLYLTIGNSPEVIEILCSQSQILRANLFEYTTQEIIDNLENIKATIQKSQLYEEVMLKIENKKLEEEQISILGNIYEEE